MKLTSSRRLPWFYQLTSLVLLPLQVVAAMPLPVLLDRAPSLAVYSFTPPPPAKVKVKRAARTTTLIKPSLQLSSESSDIQIETARVFEELLFPYGPSVDSGENQALSVALTDYYKNHSISVIVDYITQHPKSRWNGSLYLNLGLIHYQTGYLSLALKDWQQAWDILKTTQSPTLKASADRAFGELVVLDARLGRTDELKRLFVETKGRGFTGTGAEKVQAAREGYQIMKTNSKIAFKCGPFALDSVRTADKNSHHRSAVVEGAMSTTKGTSLAQVKSWSDKLNMNYQIAKKSAGVPFITPSVMHWKLGHFGALVREKNGRYLIQDPTFAGTELWVKADALEAETSGYFLVPPGSLPTGWTAVSKEEAAQVWGKGGAHARDDKDTKGCHDCSNGMAVASVFPMLATLHIQDTPLVYSTPVGPQLNLTIGYNDQEANQPATLPFPNFGNDWVFQYLSYVSIDASQNATIALRGGGTEVYNYSTFDNVNNVYAADIESQAQLYQVDTNTYERRMPDGSKDVYSQPDAAGRIFLTQIYDAQGNSQILNYDSHFRLNYIQDQIGQQTTFAYVSNTVGAAGFYKIATITDPFGRSASFQYDSSTVQLTQITDAVGMTSQFTYDSNYFLDSMTTPYGKTLFYKYTPAADSTHQARGLRITLPDGTQSITENWLGHELSTYHWSRKQSPFYPDKNKARVTKWLQEAGANFESGIVSYTKEPLEGGSGSNLGTTVATGPAGTDAPAGAVVYNYSDSYSVIPGSTDSMGNPIPLEDQVPHNYVGTSNQPTSISRILDDSSTQTTYYTHNSLGRLTSIIDPIGRSFRYFYDGNNVDLLEVRQVKSSNNDLLAKFTYNSQHLPLTYIDGSGQKTQYSYNSQGQLSTITDANSKVTTFNYDGNNYLQNIDGPLSGTHDKTSYTYDGDGRIYTVSDSEGYTLTFGYDNLDRITSVTYPDGTYEQVVWDKLDPVALRDRLGNWTQQQFDSINQLVKTTDPLGRATQYQWCTCGSLGSMTDPAGNITSWTRDLQGRASAKTYAAGAVNSSVTHYDYETNTSRLKTVTDALSQAKNYTYNADNTLHQISYTGAVNSTSTVTYTYDANYPRLSSVANGWGTVGYTYNNYITDPFGTAVTGGGRVQKITNSVIGSSADTTYTYDALGRITNRSINGSANSTDTTYDDMSRVTNITNPLGSFGYNYVDDATALGSGNDKGTTRLSSMSYPNGQVTNYSYFGNSGDERLQTIQNLNSSSAALSKFDYTYDAKGQIATWKQQADSSAATRYDMAYDTAGQAISAVKKTDSSNAVLKQYYYNYDVAGNRTSEQIDNSVTGTSVNNLNQITGQSAGGATRFQGTINEPGSVTVNGQPATMTPTSTNFVANPVLSAGTDTVTIVATDGSGNVSTNYNYNVVVTGPSSTTPTYDADGNMTDNGKGQTYQWDAENRLIKVGYSDGSYTLFNYDGLGRRVEIENLTNKNEPTYAREFLWCGAEICEEFGEGFALTGFLHSSTIVFPSGLPLSKYYYQQGEVEVGVLVGIHHVNINHFYNRDHLGSVREVIADDGETIEARYDYDPYGRCSVVGTPTYTTHFRYAGMYFEETSGLDLTFFRAYDPNTGRWLSRDPIGEGIGTNLYSYVSNNPTGEIDPLGLISSMYIPEFSPNSLTNFITGNDGGSGGCNGGIPLHPSNADVDKNMKDAANMWPNPWAFRDMVKTGGQWDYKNQPTPGAHPEYDPFGNFNYGATGTAWGFSEHTLLNEAGKAQINDQGPNSGGQGTPGSDWNPFNPGIPPYGDRPQDQAEIKAGIDYANRHGYGGSGCGH